VRQGGAQVRCDEPGNAASRALRRCTMTIAYLLTTCHVGKDGLDDLFRLIASAQTALDEGEVGHLRLIALLQGCGSAECEDVGRRLPQWVELLSIEGSLSSPAARNSLIHNLLKRSDFDPAAFVGFPDDDAWYPRGALSCVARHFRDAEDLQLLLCRYGPSPSADQCSDAFRPTLQQALSRGACAAIFVRGRLLAKLGGFHELLGLGTTLRGGEDTEFVHRAFQQASAHALCIPGFLVGHAAALPAKKAQYYEGGLAAILAHSHASAAARAALIRKLAAGVWLVLRRRQSLSQYFLAVRRAREHAPVVRAGLSAQPELGQAALTEDS
jgi:hypothetical protein